MSSQKYNDDLDIKKENESNDIILKVVFICVVIVLVFIASYIQQSSVDVESFDNCINETSCLYELISITNTTDLCDRVHNSSRCYLSFSLKLQSSQLCFKTQEPLVCILTLSLENDTNYCEEYRNSTIQSELNYSNKKVEETIQTCNKNVEYYMNNSIEEE